MVCRLFGAKHLCEPVMTYCSIEIEAIIPENVFENVGGVLFYVAHQAYKLTRLVTISIT